MMHDRARLPVAVLFTLTLMLAGCGDTARFGGGGKTAAAKAGTVGIVVLSNRADLISGGNALVEIVLPEGADAGTLAVDVDGRDVSDEFALRDNGRVMGLVTGLVLGEQTLKAKLADGRGARIVLTNHPIGGPVFAGQQVQPWTCAAGTSGPQCEREPTVEFMVKSGNGFAAYDQASPPASVPTTTTDEGVTVPYIIRVETGSIDRDEYRMAVLWDPAQPWAPWAPQAGFNRKLVIFHGASCDTGYTAAAAPDVLNDTALSRGFATMSHALNNAGHNCNILTQIEAMLMTKEHLVETFGELRYTIGSGCSGGSLVQQQLANAYPGFYQGITPACSFTDSWSNGMQREDYALWRRYFENPVGWAPGVVWDPLSIRAVIGHINPANPVVFTTAIAPTRDPSRSCPGLDASLVYDPVTNPTGTRCSIQDYMAALFGERVPESWTEVEKSLGRGFAGNPSDSMGVQYGLRSLMAGTLSPAHFVDFNSKVGSNDIDYQWVPERKRSDRPALERVYRSGAVNSGKFMNEVAIIDLRGPDPGVFHDVYRTYIMRARLTREHGHADNQVLWRGQVPIFGDTAFENDSIVAIDGWLAAVEADTREVPLPQKIVDNRNVVERCTDGLGNDVPALVCDLTVTSYTSPRIEAGQDFTEDVLKCQLKPLNPADYYPIFFTAAQWTQLEAAFPEGVCDYSLPGVDQVEVVPWLTYKNGPGGEPMGPAPTSIPLP